LHRSKEHRQRQSRGWNDDDSSRFGNASEMPSFPSFAPSSSAPEEAATVNWYNAEKGFGFVSLASGMAVGAHVVRVMADEEAGDYGEPEFLGVFGQVPEAA